VWITGEDERERGGLPLEREWTDDAGEELDRGESFLALVDGV
jgi:hypothetical protein